MDFWSKTCLFCLNEIPRLYELTKNNSAIHVVAISIEVDDLEFGHHTLNFVKWTNILALKKWQNPIAIEYEVISTPTYFVPDSDKKIISKPEYFTDIKAFLKD